MKGDASTFPIAGPVPGGQDNWVIAEYAECYRFCPRCGQPQDQRPEQPVFKCSACDFVLYFNPAVAAAALIFNADGQILAIRRARNPGQGKLALPGGFIDADESAEEAVRREVREEVGIELEDVKFLCSYPNRYPYRGVTYIVLDFYFTAKARDTKIVAAPGEIQCVFWTDPAQVRLEDLAFTSLRKTWEFFQTRR